MTLHSSANTAVSEKENRLNNTTEYRRPREEPLSDLLNVARQQNCAIVGVPKDLSETDNLLFALLPSMTPEPGFVPYTFQSGVGHSNWRDEWSEDSSDDFSQSDDSCDILGNTVYSGSFVPYEVSVPISAAILNDPLRMIRCPSFYFDPYFPDDGSKGLDTQTKEPLNMDPDAPDEPYIVKLPYQFSSILVNPILKEPTEVVMEPLTEPAGELSSEPEAKLAALPPDMYTRKRLEPSSDDFDLADTPLLVLPPRLESDYSSFPETAIGTISTSTTTSTGTTTGSESESSSGDENSSNIPNEQEEGGSSNSSVSCSDSDSEGDDDDSTVNTPCLPANPGPIPAGSAPTTGLSNLPDQQHSTPFQQNFRLSGPYFGTLRAPASTLFNMQRRDWPMLNNACSPGVTLRILPRFGLATYGGAGPDLNV
ncbi:unnamed protein product [Somion occarium]|uniref:Uncharacterized protein n=1 Tax=Somion occarium TaxID=3059160 RepID=A0ABP1EA10_9APHY